MKARVSSSPAALVVTAPETSVGLLEAGIISGMVVRGLITTFSIVLYGRLLGVEARGRPCV